MAKGILVTGCLYNRACGPRRLAWSKGWRPPGAELYSMREPSELSQCDITTEAHGL